MQPQELCRLLEEQYFGENMHERDEIELLPSFLDGVRTFVDVGASLGQYAYFAGRTIKGGHIVCIEADPVRVERLRELAATWEKDSGNRYEVIHAAAADQPGRMEFHLTDQNISGALFEHHVPDPLQRARIKWSKTEVDVVTLDRVFADGDPDFVKIDVEGAEYRVLLGAAGILSRGNCRFLVEIHPWGDQPIGKLPADVFNLFASHGYDFQRTHRHWLFSKSGNPLTRYLKNRFVVFVFRNEGLKEFIKKLILKFGKSDRR